MVVPGVAVTVAIEDIDLEDIDIEDIDIEDIDIAPVDPSKGDRQEVVVGRDRMRKEGLR